MNKYLEELQIALLPYHVCWPVTIPLTECMKKWVHNTT